MKPKNQGSGEERLEHGAMHSGEAALDAVLIIGQLFVVEAEEVQRGA